MNELILKITTPYPQMKVFLHRYTSLMNILLEKRNSAAFIENIEGGFLYISKNIDSFIHIIQTQKSIFEYEAFLKSHQEEWMELNQEFISQMKFSQQRPLLFNIESINYAAKEIQRLLYEIMSVINSNITFTPKSATIFEINFPNLTAFVDFVFIFLARLQLKI